MTSVENAAEEATGPPRVLIISAVATLYSLSHLGMMAVGLARNSGPFDIAVAIAHVGIIAVNFGLLKANVTAYYATLAVYPTVALLSIPHVDLLALPIYFVGFGVLVLDREWYLDPSSRVKAKPVGRLDESGKQKPRDRFEHEKDDKPDRRFTRKR